jgi:hypothetical protein
MKNSTIKNSTIKSFIDSVMEESVSTNPILQKEYAGALLRYMDAHKSQFSKEDYNDFSLSLKVIVRSAEDLSLVSSSWKLTYEGEVYAISKGLNIESIQDMLDLIQEIECNHNNLIMISDEIMNEVNEVKDKLNSSTIDNSIYILILSKLASQLVFDELLSNSSLLKLN